MGSQNQNQEGPSFKVYKTDEFVLKVTPAGRTGGQIKVLKRRNERRPDTLSLYKNPVFMCDVVDLLGNEKKMMELMRAILQNSGNVQEVRLSMDVVEEEDVDQPTL